MYFLWIFARKIVPFSVTPWFPATLYTAGLLNSWFLPRLACCVELPPPLHSRVLCNRLVTFSLTLGVVNASVEGSRSTKSRITLAISEEEFRQPCCTPRILAECPTQLVGFSKSLNTVSSNANRRNEQSFNYFELRELESVPRAIVHAYMCT